MLGEDNEIRQILDYSRSDHNKLLEEVNRLHIKMLTEQTSLENTTDELELALSELTNYEDLFADDIEKRPYKHEF